MLTLKGKIKKSIFLMGALFIGMTIATGCSNEDDLQQNQGNLTVVNATIDNVSGARTSVNELYQVVWSENDAFTIFSGDTKKGDLTLKGQGGATTGEFEGTLSSVLTNDDVALFPAVTDNAKTYTFKSEYTSTETDAPLYGTYNGTSFSFSPLSAFIRVNVNHFTENTQYVLTITSTGEQALTGETTLSNDVLLPPIGQGKTITVTLTPEEGATFLTFDAPIPAQTYTGLTITLKKDGDTKATILKELTDFPAVAGKLYEVTQKVYDTETLKIALANGGNVDIGSSFSLTEDLKVTENTIIDLNNQTLDAAGKTITVAEGKNLTIQNAASLVRSASNPAITSTGDIIIASANSTITIGKGVNLTTTGENCSCIWVPGSDLNNIANGVTINTAGYITATAAGSAAIYVNGNVTSGTINIISGSVKHEADVAVYIAGKADLNISGGEITGTTGVEIRGGSLNIEGGTITATGIPATATPNGNGTTTVGAAVAISQHTTNHAITATIKDGTLIGEIALYEADLQADDQKATGVTVSVNGGIFKGEVFSQSCANFINGGSFHDASAFDYLANGANVTVGVDIEISKPIIIPESITATINLNGKTISQEKKCTASYGMITNRGTLTIVDSSEDGTGKISFKDTGLGDSSFGWGSYTLINSGTLIVEKGTIENLSQQNNSSNVAHMYCAIQSTGSTTIKGGIISTPTYRSVRSNKGSLIIEGGTFEGQVWLQPNQSDVTLQISDGSFAPRGVDGSSVFMENEERYTVSSASITGGMFNTKIGCGNPTKDGVKGCVIGGVFTESAKNGTNVALLKEGYSFVKSGENYVVSKTE